MINGDKVVVINEGNTYDSYEEMHKKLGGIWYKKQFIIKTNESAIFMNRFDNYCLIRCVKTGLEVVIDIGGIQLLDSNSVKTTDKNNKIMANKVSNMAKKFVNTDTQALIDAGFLTASLELTTVGIEARDEFLFDITQENLVKLAKTKLAEEKKK